MGIVEIFDRFVSFRKRESVRHIREAQSSTGINVIVAQLFLSPLTNLLIV